MARIPGTATSGKRSIEPTRADPVKSQTVRLPASVWQRLRMLAATKNTTAAGELRAALEAHFAREWPKVSGQIEKLAR